MNKMGKVIFRSMSVSAGHALPSRAYARRAGDTLESLERIPQGRTLHRGMLDVQFRRHRASGRLGAGCVRHRPRHTRWIGIRRASGVQDLEGA